MWVPKGYACVRVDGRGRASRPAVRAVVSAKRRSISTTRIEWARAQPWCNGKVGLNGNLVFRDHQWFVANLQPPSLRAIIRGRFCRSLPRRAVSRAAPERVHDQLVTAQSDAPHARARVAPAARRLAGEHDAFLAAQQSRQRASAAPGAVDRIRCRCSRSATGPEWHCICAANP